MGYSIDPISADCYEGTTCLINKFGIKDEKKLSQMETLITTAKCQELEIRPIVGDFGFDHYKAIHKYIFEDLYDWAGKVRTASISKKALFSLCLNLSNHLRIEYLRDFRKITAISDTIMIAI